MSTFLIVGLIMAGFGVFGEEIENESTEPLSFEQYLCSEQGSGGGDLTSRETCERLASDLGVPLSDRDSTSGSQGYSGRIGGQEGARCVDDTNCCGWWILILSSVDLYLFSVPNPVIAHWPCDDGGKRYCINGYCRRK